MNDDLDSVCKELKEICFERGAEDNLTVVLVRVGQRISAHERMEELEPTVIPETQSILTAASDGNQTMVGAKPDAFMPASRIAFPGPETAAPIQVTESPLNVAAPEASKSGGSAMRILVMLLVVGLIAAAFYAGARLKDQVPFLASETKPPQPTVVAPKPVEEPFAKFERARREVDRDPRAWLASEVSKELVNAGVQNPLDSSNAEFLYLFGRANLLSGNPDEAARAFEATLAKTDANSTEQPNATIRKEATLAMAAVSLKTFSGRQKAIQHYDELTKPPANQTAP